MRISARIKPNARHSEGVTLLDDGTYEVRVKAPAVEGKANEAARKQLAKYFGVAGTKVKLLHGATSRHKVFEITLPG